MFFYMPIINGSQKLDLVLRDVSILFSGCLYYSDVGRVCWKREI